nr:putative reverse transcriptase domain-containing protein [Tanacetum cinerariifolium]
MGNTGINPDANTVMGTFLLNNCYASVLFDTGSDRSFVSSAFSSQFDIAPTVLDHDYAVELADGRIVGVNTVIRSCTLNFLNHLFNIDLMSVKMGSFDVIIGMDWLSRYQAVIVYADKIVRILWGRETLIFHEGKSKKKRLENVPIVQDFPEVFPEDLPGLPLTQQVVFRIDLIPGAAPVARLPGARLLLGKVEEGHGSGVEVVEWRKNGESGGELVGGKNGLNVNSWNGDKNGRSGAEQLAGILVGGMNIFLALSIVTASDFSRLRHTSRFFWF